MPSTMSKDKTKSTTVKNTVSLESSGILEPPPGGRVLAIAFVPSYSFM